MSTTGDIQANYTDLRIADIRNHVRLRNEGVPYALLPVRIETRFRQFVQNTAAAAASTFSVESVLEGLGKIHLQVVEQQATPLSADSLRATASILADTAASIPEGEEILIKETGWMKQLYNDLEKDLAAMMKKTNGSFTAEVEEINASMLQWKQAMKRFKLKPDPESEGVKKMIGQMKKVHSNISRLNGERKKIPYLNIKNKKALYHFISNTLSELETFYGGSAHHILQIENIDRNQVKKIDEMHTALAKEVAQTLLQAGTIHSDANWKKFIAEKVTPRIQNLGLMTEQFSAQAMPMLKEKPLLPAIKTGALLVHGIQSLIKLKKYNTDPYAGFEKHKHFRLYVKPRIDMLSKTIHQVIKEEKPGHAAKLRDMYAAIGHSLEEAAGQLARFKPRNQSQLFGVNMLDTYIKTTVAPTLSSFAGNTDQGTLSATGVSEFPQAVITPLATTTRYQLLVRIYPDDIFIDTHEEALTRAEQDAGRLFWKIWWAASFDKDLEKGGWRTLCANYGTKRASWIARTVKPDFVNNAQNRNALNSRPSAKLTEATQLVKTAYTRLGTLPLGLSPIGIFILNATVATLQSVQATCSTAAAAMRTITGTQDYLLEKCRSQLAQAGSIISQLIAKRQQLTPSEAGACATSLTAFQAIINSYNDMQTQANAMLAYSPLEYVDQLTDPFVYPAVTLKTDDWSTAPLFRCLPDKFVVVTQTGGIFQHIITGNPVPSTLKAGLDPAKFANADTFSLNANGDMVVDPDIKWMTDYDDAQSKGMAITVELTAQQYATGFDKVVVLGVRNSSATDAKAALEDLLMNHTYAADGMEFLKTGTPTNNTHYRKSGYQPDGDEDIRFDIEVENKRFITSSPDVYKLPDGKRLADALGIDVNVLQYVNNGHQTEIGNAMAINRALWSGTMGHYMEEMFDTLFTYDNIRRTEQFFTNYVFGRGSLPSIRVGEQPYGILPTTAFSRFVLYGSLPSLTATELQNAPAYPLQGATLNNKLQIRFEYRLHELLKVVYNEYNRLAASEVMSYQKLVSSQQHAARFVEMLCLHPVSLDFVYRQSINVARGPNASPAGFSTNFTATDLFGPNGFFEMFKQHILQGVFEPSFHFSDQYPPFPSPNWRLEDVVYSRIKQQLTGARNFGNRYLTQTPAINRELVDKLPASWEAPLGNLPGRSYHYIDWILQQTAEGLLGGNDIGNLSRLPSNSLFFLLLRQSLLQGYQEAALNIMQSETLINEPGRRLLGSQDRYHFREWAGSPAYLRHYYVTKWHTLFSYFDQLPTILRDTQFSTKPFYNYINSASGLRSMARYLDQVRGPLTSLNLYNASHRSHFEKLKGIRDAYEHIKNLPTAALELLMGEHVDLATHRLDAWMLGLVNMRLSRQRMWTGSGLYLGAYGYVENLRPDVYKTTETNPVLSEFNLPAGKPVYREQGNQGFIHAGSISQAITAAVLRSAYMSNVNAEDEPNRLAINLSSARVRLAMGLIAGMRNGQSLGALLGFQFERGLHERYNRVELDLLIQPFRKRFPLTQAVAETAATGTPAYQGLTVDGVGMLQLAWNSTNWLQQKSVRTMAALLKENNYQKLPLPIKQIVDDNFPANRNLVYDNVIDEIDRMADAFDALGDLAVSESVYQIVQGNHVKAAAVLNALAQGKTIPQPEVIDTLRSGTVVTHRVLYQMPTFVSAGQNNFTAPPGWEGNATPRAQAEPSLNYWLGRLLGPMVQYKCVVTRQTLSGGSTNFIYTMESPNWQPIDLLCLSGGADEMRDYIRQHYTRAVTNDVHVTVDFTTRHSSFTENDKTFDELFILLRHLCNLLGSARCAGAGDLRPAAETVASINPGQFDTGEYNSRITRALNALRNFNTTVAQETFMVPILNGTMAPAQVVLSNADFNRVLSYLNQAVLLGIPNAMGSAAGLVKTGNRYYTQALEQLYTVYKESKKRETDALAHQAGIAGSTPAGQVEKLSDLAKLCFGRNMITLPVFMPPNLTDLRNQLNFPDSTRLTRFTGRLTMEDWLQSIGKVRARMKDLQQTNYTADMYGSVIPSIQPVQLPYRNGDYWLGMSYPSSYTPAEDKLSLVLINEKALTQQSWQSGLVLDEWLEIIPAKQETTGLVFNYDQPNATAPQSILLAVVPSANLNWTWDDLVHTIIDTVEMSKIRAVEPDHLSKSFLGHALYGVVSEVPPPMVNDPDRNPLGVQATMNFSATEKP
jgi:hypothetical protein